MSEAFVCDHCGELYGGRPAAQGEVGPTDTPEQARVDFCEGCFEDLRDRWGVFYERADDE